jgi:hypothetical protein
VDAANEGPSLAAGGARDGDRGERDRIRMSRSKAAGGLLAVVVVIGIVAGVVSRALPTPARCPVVASHPDWSVARRWDEALLDAIRRALPNPPVHARNLFHASVAMWDAWATYDPIASEDLFSERHTAAGSSRQWAAATR